MGIVGEGSGVGERTGVSKFINQSSIGRAVCETGTVTEGKSSIPGN